MDIGILSGCQSHYQLHHNTKMLITFWLVGFALPVEVERLQYIWQNIHLWFQELAYLIPNSSLPGLNHHPGKMQNVPRATLT